MDQLTMREWLMHFVMTQYKMFELPDNSGSFYDGCPDVVWASYGNLYTAEYLHKIRKEAEENEN